MRKIWVLLTLALLGCCGYSTRALLPAYLKTIHILRVDNRTLHPLLAENLNDELTSTFTRDGRLRVSSDPSADLVLTVDITSYKRTAAVYDASRNVSEWRYEMGITGECRDQVKNSILWKGQEAVAEVFSADMDEEEAISRLIKSTAETIVRDVLLAW